MISSKARIGKNTIIGHYTVVEDDVIIGDNCQIGHNVVIKSGSIIGDNVRIDEFTSIGKLPMKSPNSAVTKQQDLPAAKISDNCIIGTGAVIYKGAKINENVLIADLATIREDVTIGNNTIVGRGVTIENHTRIGEFCKLESNCYITAYSDIESYCFVAPCVVTSNDNYAGRTKERFKHFKGVTIKKGGRIGAGAVILPGKTIAEDGFVAAGSTVTKDVEQRKIVAGNPARVLRDLPEEQLLENQKL